MKTSAVRKRLTAALTMLVVLNACKDSTGPGNEVPPRSSDDQILVRANVDGVHILIREDGSVVHRYGGVPANAAGPAAWSPEGDEFLLRTYSVDGRQGVVGVSLDGSRVTPLLEGWRRISGEVVVVEPGGGYVAFIGETIDDPSLPYGRNGIWRVGADGTGLTPLWIVSDGTGDPMQWPRLRAISPDGSRVLYAVLDQGEWHLRMANVDGSGSADVSGDLLLNHPLGGSVQWAPDGRSAFVGRQLPHGLEIHQLAAGSAPRLLFTHDVETWLWSVSPMGGHVALYRQVAGNPETLVMRTDGTGVSAVLPGRSEFLEWSPDGAEVAAVIVRETNSRLWLLPADGSQPRDLISSGYQPAWRRR